MSIMTTALITGFPEELQHLVAEYLTMQDLNQCTRVSHVWQNLFDSDGMWEPIAKKFNIKKKEINSFHQFVNTTIVNHLPNFFKIKLLNDYKSLVCQKFLLEEEDIQRKCPKEFLEVFGGVTAIRNLPSIEITFNELIIELYGLREFFSFKTEHFSSPIVRATLKDDNSEKFFILFRIRNNETRKIYRDAISFYYSSGRRFFNLDHTKPPQRIISPEYSNVSQEKLDRLQRLIQRKPVGIINMEGPYCIMQESRTIYSKGVDSGKSVLELC
jgi:hypothetical protein